MKTMNIPETVKKLRNQWIEKFNSESFKRHIIRVTKANRYYTWDSKLLPIDTLAAYLKENKIKKHEVLFMDDFGGQYNWHTFFKVVEKNDVLFVLQFYCQSGVRSNLQFKVYSWGSSLAIEKDGTFWRCPHNDRYDVRTGKLDNIKSSDAPLYSDDIDYVGHIKAAQSRYNMVREISTNTKKLISEFLSSAITEESKNEIISSSSSYWFWTNIANAFKRKRVTKQIGEDVQKMLNNIKRDISGFAKVGMTIRYDDIIAYYGSWRIQFYDLANQKKYAIDNYGNAFHSNFRFEQAYGYDNENSPLRNQSYLIYRNRYGNISDTYNKNGGVITASECFKGSYIETVFSKFRDKYVASFTTTQSNISMGEFDDNGLIPLFVLQGLFASNEIKKKLDLMINSDLFYAYQSACEIGNGGYTYDREKFIKAMRQKGKNMSSVLNLPNGKIRKIEKAASQLNRYNGTIIGFSKIYNFVCTFDFLNLRSLDDKHFDQLVENAQRSDLYYNYNNIRYIYNDLQKPISTFFDIIFEYGHLKSTSYLGLYKDYLNMRRSLKECCGDFDDHKWPAIPTPIRTVVTLRPIPPRYYWEAIKSPSQQLEDYYRIYGKQNISVLDKNDTGDRIIIGLDLRLKDDCVRFLHDEITPIAQIYKDKVELSNFIEATKRVSNLVFEDDNFEIISPTSPDDLTTEGHTLSHCVAGFAKAICRGSENVMFLRRKSCKNVPFFTIALNNNRTIEQIHCYRNGNITIRDQEEAYASSGLESYKDPIDIIPFLTKWCKEKKISGLHTRYGALGAH